MADAIVDTWRDVERETPERARTASCRSRAHPGRDGATAGSRARLAPVPGRLELPHRPAFARRPADPGRRACPTARRPVGVLDELAEHLRPARSRPTRRSAAVDPGITTDDFQALGIPVPENYSAPVLRRARGGRRASTSRRSGSATSCSRSARASSGPTSRSNIKTRTDSRAGQRVPRLRLGRSAAPSNGDAAAAPGPAPTRATRRRNLPADHRPASSSGCSAQVNNDANGWNDLANVLRAESEPPTRARSRATTRTSELPACARLPADRPDLDGQRLQRLHRDLPRVPARRPLPQGAHRLGSALQRLPGHAAGARWAAHLHGGAARAAPPRSVEAKVDRRPSRSTTQRATRSARSATTSVAAYEAALPDDGGSAAAGPAAAGHRALRRHVLHLERRLELHRQPARQGAAPAGRRVARLRRPVRRDAGDARVPAAARTCRATCRAGRNGTGRPTSRRSRRTSTPTRATAPRRRGPTASSSTASAARAEARLPTTSSRATFEVRRWDGITVDAIKVDRNGRVVFTVGPRHSHDRFLRRAADRRPTIGPIDYPDSYDSPIPFIKEERAAFSDPAAPTSATKLEWYCFRCSFRPWADTGRPEIAYLTFVRRDGSRTRVRARERTGASFYSTRALRGDETAFVAAGDVRDAFGNVNGADSASVGRRSGR